MKKLFTSFLSLGVLLLSSPAQAASAFDPVGHQSLPLLGSACSKSGSIIKNSYFQFTCSNKSGSTIWTGTSSKYKAPVNYLKGYALGQALKKANPTVGNGSLVCKNSADGYVVKSFEIQAGSISSSNKTILNDYFGYMGCWDGFSSTKAAPTQISLPDPVGPVLALHSEQLVNSFSEVGNLFSGTVDAFQQDTGSGNTQNGLDWIASNQYPDAFDTSITSNCSADRISSNWTINSMEPDFRTLSYDYGYPYVRTPDANSDYFQEFVTTNPYPETPLRVFVWSSYRDDTNGDHVEASWYHVIFMSDGSPRYFLSQCPMDDESLTAGNSSWNLSKAAAVVKTPVGKVDKTSNAYKTMFTVGQNFAKVSTASDTAKSQCSSAMATGMIKARGIPTYLGLQARQLQSYLNTPSGYQGCLDGFGH